MLCIIYAPVIDLGTVNCWRISVNEEWSKVLITLEQESFEDDPNPNHRCQSSESGFELGNLPYRHSSLPTRTPARLPPSFLRSKHT